MKQNNTTPLDFKTGALMTERNYVHQCAVKEKTAKIREAKEFEKEEIKFFEACAFLIMFILVGSSAMGIWL